MCVSLILSFIPLKTGSPISKLVLLKLADNADARGVCFPSLNYLAQYCEVSVRTVKRHINELEKQGFVKRIKRFDDSGRQRSNLYQLRLPSGSHIQQADLDQAARALAQEDGDQEQENSDKTDQYKSDFNTHSPNLPISDHSDTHQGDSRSNTESDRPAHIIFHKEHKTELNLKNGISDGADVLNTPNRSAESDTSISTSTSKNKTKNEAVIDLLTKEGCAPIYHEFYEILKRTYPKLDVLQELHAMQAWLYINPDKRKPFEHIGHFVNGWLRRSAQAQTKRGSTPAFKKTRVPKQTQASKQKRTAKPTNSIKALGSITAARPTTPNMSTADLHHTHSIQNDKAESKSLEPKQPTPVTQALADYKAKSTTNPFEERIKALIQSKSTSTDNKQ
ncbi:helix-turn-helix domain-containing protein [Vibrio cyclitrophicus]|uniref:Transcriptional regulator n=2 Tax=Vibrio cyclitrophicus TaxID=47951 RepID=A0A7Z1MIV4_9VIBR|nr:helix-turn-helix domain-containing protein [Vibrio cyclitrophicus]MCC4775163.1 helix-turn-helix domain-containing protein [Vibrio cyclitrophicus]MCC4841141.1 helix-turn-helix domain-containing protein [Vibrio cyclitrophicus]PME12491.1 transcriptional regulator [Vibrio cyclitrophicus]PME46911.1 transcriptional regulator [Vibrio cyclitrophicus]PME76037.1 transcriptional regulator [Vibrio cyclitrophicus]